MSIIRSVLKPFENSWDKLRENGRMISQSEAKIVDLTVKKALRKAQRQLKNSELTRLREELSISEAEGRLATTQLATLNPFSWFFSSAKIDVTADTEKNEQVDLAESELDKIDYLIEQLNKDLKSEETKLTKATFGRNMAVVELIGIVSASYFAYAAAMALIYNVGFTAIVMTGVYSIPALIFYDLYLMAQNIDSLYQEDSSILDDSVELEMRQLFRNMLYLICPGSSSEENKFDIANTRAKIITRNTIILRLFEANIRDMILGESFINFKRYKKLAITLVRIPSYPVIMAANYLDMNYQIKKKLSKFLNKTETACYVVALRVVIFISDPLGS